MADSGMRRLRYVRDRFAREVERKLFRHFLSKLNGPRPLQRALLEAILNDRLGPLTKFVVRKPHETAIEKGVRDLAKHLTEWGDWLIDRSTDIETAAHFLVTRARHRFLKWSQIKLLCRFESPSLELVLDLLDKINQHCKSLAASVRATIDAYEGRVDRSEMYALVCEFVDERDFQWLNEILAKSDIIENWHTVSDIAVEKTRQTLAELLVMDWPEPYEGSRVDVIVELVMQEVRHTILEAVENLAV